MGGPPEPREARAEGKLHDPPIQGNASSFRPWMAGSEAGHGEEDERNELSHVGPRVSQFAAAFNGSESVT